MATIKEIQNLPIELRFKHALALFQELTSKIPTMSPEDQEKVMPTLHLYKYILTRDRETLDKLDKETKRHENIAEKYEKLLELKDNYESAIELYKSLKESGKRIPSELAAVIRDYKKSFKEISSVLPKSMSFMSSFEDLEKSLKESMNDSTFKINSLKGIYDPEVLAKDRSSAEKLKKKIEEIEAAKNRIDAYNTANPGLNNPKALEDLKKLIASCKNPTEKAELEKKKAKLEKHLEDVATVYAASTTNLFENSKKELEGLYDKYDVTVYDDLIKKMDWAKSNNKYTPPKSKNEASTKLHEAKPAPSGYVPPSSENIVNSQNNIPESTPGPNKQVLPEFVGTGYTDVDLETIKFNGINLGTTTDSFTYARQVKDDKGNLRISCIRESIEPYLRNPRKSYEKILRDVYSDKYLIESCRNSAKTKKDLKIYSNPDRLVRHAMKRWKEDCKRDFYSTDIIRRAVAVRSATTPEELRAAINDKFPPAPHSNNSSYNIVFKREKKGFFAETFYDMGVVRPRYNLVPVKTALPPATPSIFSTPQKDRVVEAGYKSIDKKRVSKNSDIDR